MVERVFILVIAFGSMLLYDGFKLKNKISKREKTVYGILLIFCLYAALDYIVNKNWLDYYDVIKSILGGTAKKIDDFLNVNK
ncbi:hypothetical protein [Paenibacillus sp. Soil522]|uniref:hypothetical protein n=1 Tax=Paenibacillus sp. Soil522 TaxID=1736388 RepID=UPI0006F36170|nr:hypothetical protein [Paenibacillus sp. Soil522]KRE49033.1 hypothetical protein ASG81_05720 [Paenibacillus sp. Soil522]